MDIFVHKDVFFAGDESSMLEDMCVAVAELGTVSFKVNV